MEERFVSTRNSEEKEGDNKEEEKTLLGGREGKKTNDSYTFSTGHTETRDQSLGSPLLNWFAPRYLFLFLFLFLFLLLLFLLPSSSCSPLILPSVSTDFFTRRFPPCSLVFETTM